MKISSLLNVILGICIILQCMLEVQNSPTFGRISGKVIKVGNKYLRAYLGIPYVAPPVGDLRFQEPQRVKAWNSIYNATRKSSSCMQDLNSYFDEWHKRDPKDVSEDCLYLNVWVPASKSEYKPFATMVWIYGGGFTSGSTSMEVYDGATIASVGNVIAVSFNYRLGAFGFANFDQKTAGGNMGMLDQVMALKWVHRNIGAFGGDKELITIFGESAGSIAVAHHLISPLTKGLFKRAILQSGTNYLEYFNVDPKVNFELISELSQEFECSKSDILSCMREVNASKIVDAENNYLLKNEKILGFAPQKGLPYLPDNPRHSIDTGKFHDVDVMIGETMDEGSLYVFLIKPEFATVDNPVLSKSEAKSILGKLYSLEGEPLDRIFEVYLGNVSENDSPTILKQMIKAMGDGLYTCPIFQVAEKLSKYNRKVYHYTFNHTRIKSGIKKWAGVPHFEDVYFVLGLPYVRKDDFTLEELQFSKKTIELWTSFAKTGKPTYKGMKEEWKPFDEEERNSISLTLGNIHVREAREEKCTFWKEFQGYN